MRVFCHDAVEVLEQSIPDAALDRVLLFFPDPWPKKKHHKRRILQPSFVALIARKLKPGGVSARPDYRPVTKFERRGQRLGHGVWDLLYRRA